MTIATEPPRPTRGPAPIGVLPPFRGDPRALCRYLEDPDVMYPVHGSQNGAAKRVCKPCPLKDECGEWAIKHDEFGVWGGLSEKERRKIRKERCKAGEPS
jgi:hypothetical protein